MTLSSDTPGASIYYTTDGSNPVPGAGSTKLYTSAIAVGSTQTIKAVATLAGLTTSPVASATYTIVVGGTGINFVDGFSSSQSVMTFNGTTILNDTRLQLTNGGLNQAGSAWFNTPVNITNFTNDFAFQLENADADGITFTIQNNGLNSLGGAGGGLGYTGMPKSVAIKFDLYNNNGEGDDSTGIYQNGAAPNTPFVDLTGSGIDLHNGDTFSVHMTYDGATLAMTITDGVTGAAFSNSWAINIPQVLGSNTAYVGFTGGTGGTTASQKIETWTYLSGAGTQQATATPTFSPASGTYLGTQTVTISDATSGAAIFYTTNGSTPVTTAGGSTLAYNGPLTITGTQTIKAVAKSSTLAASSVATGDVYHQPAGRGAGIFAGWRHLCDRAVGDHHFFDGRGGNLLHRGRFHANDVFHVVRGTDFRGVCKDDQGYRGSQRILQQRCFHRGLHHQRGRRIRREPGRRIYRRLHGPQWQRRFEWNEAAAHRWKWRRSRCGVVQLTSEHPEV